MEGYLNGYPESENIYDTYAAKIVKNEVIVGRMPKDIAKIFSFALYSGGEIDATGKHENKQKKWFGSSVLIQNVPKLQSKGT